MLILRLAWRNIWRHTRRTMITALAMSVGVALCLAYLAIAEGMFGHIFELMVSRQIGHAQIHHPEFTKRRALYDVVPDGASIEEKVRALPEVKAVAARVYGFALVASGEKATGAQLLGIQPSNEQAMRRLRELVKEGEYLSETAEAKALLGFELAKTLKAKVGDELVVVTQAADGSMGNEVYKIAGLLSTGAVVIDKTGVLVHLADAQELLALDDGVHELALLAADREAIPSMAESVRALVDNEKVKVRTWDEISPPAKQWMAMQDVAILIIAVLVFGVAGLGILNTMLMSVFERTRELGVLIALGLKPRIVLLLVVAETLLLTVLAVLFGLVLGALVDWYLVVEGINFGTVFEFQGMRWDPVIKGVVKPAGIVVTLVMVFVVSFFASLWPAARAARLKPVVAMREQ